MNSAKFERLVGLGLVASLSACSTYNAGPAPDTSSQIVADACPVMEGSNFKAWLNMMPGNGEPKLNVRGQVVFPSAGYTHELKLGILDRRQPPTQRLIIEVTAPSAPSAQVLTTQEVSGQFPALASKYQAITIVCGTKVLAEITEIDKIS
ncbi:hypothetical protein EH31_10335 [Erythrobacter longus]|uniref:Lipoprotein n=2 Tax=Erythrobacter longus TaxID=1044 RepID=A0A074M6T4_ERYLO|nr:hypothetical protein EH31_10335 [Erythrobacter longus]